MKSAASQKTSTMSIGVDIEEALCSYINQRIWPTSNPILNAWALSEPCSAREH
jgi:hypothetical protein